MFAAPKVSTLKYNIFYCHISFAPLSSTIFGDRYTSHNNTLIEQKLFMNQDILMLQKQKSNLRMMPQNFASHFHLMLF